MGGGVAVTVEEQGPGYTPLLAEVREYVVGGGDASRKWHISRGFLGQQHIEAGCHCPQLPCGYVAQSQVFDSDCPQHSFDAAKTIRSGHPASSCPALPTVLAKSIGRAWEDFCHALDSIAAEHDLDSDQFGRFVLDNLGDMPAYDEWMQETWEADA